MFSIRHFLDVSCLYFNDRCGFFLCVYVFEKKREGDTYNLFIPDLYYWKCKWSTEINWLTLFYFVMGILIASLSL